MPITQLDSKTALVVIDMQKGIAAMATAHPMEAIIGRIAQLARGFRQRGLPVVLVNVTGVAPGRTDAPPRTFPPQPDFTELVPELEAQAGDYLLSKQRWGAFVSTALDAYLRERSVTQIVLAGVATSAGVESTARSLYDAGYNVSLIVDAMTDRDADSHRHSVEKIFPRLGETGAAGDFLKLLQQ